MIVQVQLFAGARDRVGKGSVPVEIAGDCSVGQLRKQLMADFPQLADIVPRAMVAVNADYATDEAMVSSTSEIALIPPVSGG